MLLRENENEEGSQPTVIISAAVSSGVLFLVLIAAAAAYTVRRQASAAAAAGSSTVDLTPANQWGPTTTNREPQETPPTLYPAPPIPDPDMTISDPAIPMPDPAPPIPDLSAYGQDLAAQKVSLHLQLDTCGPEHLLLGFLVLLSNSERREGGVPLLPADSTCLLVAQHACDEIVAELITP